MRLWFIVRDGLPYARCYSQDDPGFANRFSNSADGQAANPATCVGFVTRLRKLLEVLGDQNILEYFFFFFFVL